MIVNPNRTHPTYQCCPECGGTEWSVRKGRPVNSPLYDCVACQTIMRVNEVMCPNEEQIWSMAADLLAHRGMTWSEAEE